MKAVKPKELLKMVDVAELFRVSVSTIKNWTAENKIPHVKIKGTTRFDPDVLADWIKAGGPPHETNVQ
jgi:excisionase family DNA binding protein